MTWDHTLDQTYWALVFCFSFFILYYWFLVMCARLSWPHSAFQTMLKSSW